MSTAEVCESTSKLNVLEAQNCWVFGLLPLSGILETRKHNVSETESVSVLRLNGEETPTLFGPVIEVNFQRDQI
jgi:hypothetical protein